MKQTSFVNAIYMYVCIHTKSTGNLLKTLSINYCSNSHTLEVLLFKVIHLFVLCIIFYTNIPQYVSRSLYRFAQCYLCSDPGARVYHKVYHTVENSVYQVCDKIHSFSLCIPSIFIVSISSLLCRNLLILNHRAMGNSKEEEFRKLLNEVFIVMAEVLSLDCDVSRNTQVCPQCLVNSIY